MYVALANDSAALWLLGLELDFVYAIQDRRHRYQRWIRVSHAPVRNVMLILKFRFFRLTSVPC